LLFVFLFYRIIPFTKPALQLFFSDGCVAVNAPAGFVMDLSCNIHTNDRQRRFG